jgi:pseudaminic acid synthase
MKDIFIDGKKIGKDQKPFIVAEMSGNHNQSLETALKIVEAAAFAGADAIKLQTYTPETMTIDSRGGLFEINDNKSLWNGYNLYELYKKAYTPWEWHKTIFDKASELGLAAFSTPFDEKAVDFLESLNVSAYKIASFENSDWKLLEKVAKTGKPIIMSTGASTLADLDESIRLLRENNSGEIILLKCTSTYPASPKDSNLLTIPHLREMFDCNAGVSDHTMGIGVSIASVALGAVLIEKHFTLNRGDGGVDSAFSIEPEELKNLVIESDNVYLSLGKIHYGILESEKNSLRYKRSIYAVKDIDINEILTEDNVRIIRPGDGLAPKYYDTILGKTVKTKLSAGTPLSWSHI